MKERCEAWTGVIPRVLLLPPILLFHVVLIQLFLLQGSVEGQDSIYSLFAWHFYLLLLISTFLSVLLVLIPSRAILILLFKIGLFFLLTYPFGLQSDIPLLLLLILITEHGVYLDIRWSCLYILLSFLVSLSLIEQGSVFYRTRGGAELADIVMLWSVSLLYAAALLALKWAVGRSRRLQAKNAHLRQVVTQLSHANLDFQRYVHSVEYAAVNSERRRISREIHDTVGYSLTNILMTLEASTDLLESNRDRAREALQRSISEAQSCLEETRASMRKMRTNELKEAVGMHALAQLTRSFGEATGMEIRVEYGNVPNSLGREVDLILFRIVQEGITNSFRHGGADSVIVSLWINDGDLHISVLDNGRGPSEIVEGIGISGMRERVESVGGEIFFVNQGDGFKVSARLPIAEVQYGDY